MKLTLMYFSPTHTTKKIVSAVGKVFFEKLLCETAVADITPLAARMRDYTFGEEDILVFGAPVYGGRVAPPAAEVLRGLHGNSARAVVVCVYGNRDYDDALLESRDLLEQAGFRVWCRGRLYRRAFLFRKGRGATSRHGRSARGSLFRHRCV